MYTHIILCVLCPQLLRLMVSRLHHDLHEDQIRKIAELAHGHVGADLRALCMEGMYV